MTTTSVPTQFSIGMENSPVQRIRRAQEVLNSMVPDCDEVKRGETRQDKLKELIRTQQWPHLARDMRTQLQQVVMNHDALFVLGPNEIGTIKGLPANIPLVNEQPVRGPQYRYPEKAKEKGIEPDPETVKAVTDCKPPTNVKQVRQFLGMWGFYRKHVSNFAKIA
ncbi:uncharacterized protein LOC121860028 [Homarus americanus]|uniref:uncharacterized protein LOC121860028 n=1 Tax=Homarus americanus TaxID=6706 RepID=UPI001C47937E|nr:uncharacterized protein LOC121860028 [Homarus americanus]